MVSGVVLTISGLQDSGGRFWQAEGHVNRFEGPKAVSTYQVASDASDK